MASNSATPTSMTYWSVAYYQKQHLRQIFERLSHYGIIIHLQKCVFGASSDKFLGYIVEGNRIHLLSEKVQAVVDFPQPTSRHQFRTFFVPCITETFCIQVHSS